MRHLTHGVTVWLCPAHVRDEYAVRAGGEVFVARLAAAWAAAGALTSRRLRALDAHLDRVRSPASPRTQPGSYSWPKLRREAERRFAAGEPPNDVIAELRHGCGDGPALAPSVRTMRRWFTEARWLGPPAPLAPHRRPGRRRPRSRLGRLLAGLVVYSTVLLPEPRALDP